jgi:hypothetical protein
MQAASHLPAFIMQEAGAAWIRRMHADPAYNATFRLYFDTLPTTDEVLSPEMWTQDMVAALQSPELVRSLPACLRRSRCPVKAVTMELVMRHGSHTLSAL